MIVVSDSSPLIALAKIDTFDLLRKLFSELFISTEVYPKSRLRALDRRER